MLTHLIILLVGVSIQYPTNGSRKITVVVRDSSTALKVLTPDTFTVYNLLPVLPESLSYDEFKYLQLRITDQDKIWSFLLPGYIHFETYDSRNGFITAAVRMIGYGMIAYSLYAGVPGSIRDINLSRLKTNLLILGVGAGMNFFGWLYDIVHGEYRLREKQLEILYKYRKTYPMEGNSR